MIHTGDFSLHLSFGKLIFIWSFNVIVQKQTNERIVSCIVNST